MTTMTVLTAAESRDAVLPDAGVRAGADSGDPRVGLLSLQGAHGGSIGIWECQPGGWPVVCRPNTEVAYFLEGVAIITDEETSVAHTVRAGDMIILPPAWSGRWEIVEPVRKLFVIF